MAYKNQCGGKKRSSGGLCTRPAGWGTDHVGQGKCKLHGGCSGKNFMKHGRYSKIKHARVGELTTEFRDDPKWKRVNEEIALLRALLTNFVEQTDEMKFQDGETLDTIMKLSDSVGRMIERQERALNSSTITMETLSRVMDCVADVVKKHIDDPAVLLKIQAGWNEIAVMPKK